MNCVDVLAFHCDTVIIRPKFCVITANLPHVLLELMRCTAADLYEDALSSHIFALSNILSQGLARLIAQGFLSIPRFPSSV